MARENKARILAASLPKSLMAYAHAYAKAWKAEGERGESNFAKSRTYAHLLKISLDLFWYELRKGSTVFTEWDTSC